MFVMGRYAFDFPPWRGIASIPVEYDNSSEALSEINLSIHSRYPEFTKPKQWFGDLGI
jgi:hypothetical protein